MFARDLASAIHTALIPFGNVQRVKEPGNQYQITVGPTFVLDTEETIDSEGNIINQPIKTVLKDSDYSMVVRQQVNQVDLIKFGDLRRFLSTIDEISHLPVLTTVWRGYDLNAIQVYSYWKPLFQPRKVSLVTVGQSSVNVKDTKSFNALLGRYEERDMSQIMYPEEFFSFMEFFNSLIKRKDSSKASIMDAIGEVTVNDILNRVSCSGDLHIMYNYKEIPVNIIVDAGLLDQYAFCATFDSQRFVLGTLLN